MEPDSQILLDKIPSEIWMKVFNKIEEKKRSDVIENSINSSVFFRHLLENKMTTILFPKVFQVLLPKYEKTDSEEFQEDDRPQTEEDNNSDNSSSDEDDDNEYPHSRPRRKKYKKKIYEGKVISSKQAPILKMRQICKTWCNTIDHHYQNLDYHYKMENDYDPVSKGIDDYSDSESYDNTDEYEVIVDEKLDGEEWSNEQFNCWKYKEPLQLIKHYKDSHSFENVPRNPFVGRSISIGEGSPGSLFHDFQNDRAAPKDYTFWNGITTILEKYGEEIWYCDINIRDKFPSRVEYYRQIKQWLVLMPNLKVLKLSYRMKMPDIKYPTSVELNLLQFEVNGNPLPELKELRFLKTHRLPGPIFNEIVKKSCGTLEMIEVTKHKCQVGYDIYSVDMPNLKQLSIEIGSLGEFQRMNELTVNWNLEKLYMIFGKEVDFIKWSLICKLIKNKWSDTLTNLVIGLPTAKKNGEKVIFLKDLASEDFQLEMPNVERFKLIIGNQVPIDFILPLKDKLEVFEIGFLYKWAPTREQEEEQAKNSKQLLELVGYEDRFYESNIWKIFPKLQRIQVWFENGGPICWKSVDNLYTREKWEIKNVN